MIQYIKCIACFLVFIIVTGNADVFGQQIPVKSAPDTLQEIEILNASKFLSFKTINDTTKLTIIVGNVKLRQGTTLFYCDSCVVNNNTHIFEAWGHVHINDSDTTDIYSNHLRYLMQPKLAYLDGDVKLTDGKGVLTTPDLEYDMQTNIGIYKHGGKVINKKSILTSDEGWYYSDMRDIYFKKHVVLKDPAYNIVTDSLLYNTETQTTRFISMTTITDSTGRIIKTKEGYYNQQTGKAEFGQRPTMVDGDVEATADRAVIDDSTGISQLVGNAIVIDKKNKTTIIAGTIFRNKKTDAIMAIKKPLMIIVQENDSVYISADTLFSARLTDLYSSKRPLRMSFVSPDSSAVIDTIIAKNSKDTSGKNSLARDTIVLTQKPIVTPAKDSSARKLTAVTTTDSSKIRNDSLANNILAKDTSVTPLNPVLVKGNDSIRMDKKHADTSLTRKRISLGNLKGFTDPATATTKAVVTDTVIARNAGGMNKTRDSILVYSTKGMKMVALNEKDSSNRYFEAYRHVRIFNDSLQAICDSMFYSFKDSVFRLYQDPVIWAQQNQITGDTVLLFTKNKKADKVEAFENGFMINKLDVQAFNQIKSTRIDGYFLDGNVDSVRAKGYAQCIYYIQNEDSAFTGVNESKSDIMDIYFRNKQLFKVVFRSSVTGTLWPIQQKSPSEMRLTNFRWLDSKRPKTKLEMYE